MEMTAVWGELGTSRIPSTQVKKISESIVRLGSRCARCKSAFAGAVAQGRTVRLILPGGRRRGLQTVLDGSAQLQACGEPVTPFDVMEDSFKNIPVDE